MLDPDIGLLIAAALSLLLAHSSWHKWRDLDHFAAAVRAYDMLPRSGIWLWARLIATLESGIAIGLLLPDARPAAAGSASALLIAYAIGIGINISRGRRELDCGCAGAGERRPIGWWMVMRNVMLALAAAGVGGSQAARPMNLLDDFTVGAGLVVVSLLYASVEKLLGATQVRARANGRFS